MKGQRLAFCRKYATWTKEQWRKVMFSDESTFRLVCGTAKRVRRPKSVSHYDRFYTVNAVKLSQSVMVWGALTGNAGRAGLYFLPKGQTINGVHYMDVLKEHLPPFNEFHECAYFTQDGAPPHIIIKLASSWLTTISVFWTCLGVPQT